MLWPLDTSLLQTQRNGWAPSRGCLNRQTTERRLFCLMRSSTTFSKFGNTDKVSHFAKPLWDDGHRSCRSVASIKLKILEKRYGEDIRQCHSFCRLRIDTDTRAQLLQATLPEPKMSTIPSGLVQTEQPRASHPHKLETFDVTVDVLAYIDSLPSTKKPPRRQLTPFTSQWLPENLLWRKCGMSA